MIPSGDHMDRVYPERIAERQEAARERPAPRPAFPDMDDDLSIARGAFHGSDDE